MKYLMIICAVVFVNVLCYRHIDARHLTDTKSDAATRPGVKFQRKPADASKVETIDAVVNGVKEIPAAQTAKQESKGQNVFNDGTESIEHRHKISTGNDERIKTDVTRKESLYVDTKNQVESIVATEKYVDTEENLSGGKSHVDEALTTEPEQQPISAGEQPKRDNKTLNARSEFTENVQSNDERHSLPKATLPEPTAVSTGNKGYLENNEELKASISNGKADALESMNMGTKPIDVPADNNLNTEAMDENTPVRNIPTKPFQDEDKNLDGEQGFISNEETVINNDQVFGNWDQPSGSAGTWQTHTFGIPKSTDDSKDRLPNDFDNFGGSMERNGAEVGGFRNNDLNADVAKLFDNRINRVPTLDNKSDTREPRVTVLVEEKNGDNDHTRRILAGNGNGLVQSHVVNVNSETSSNVPTTSLDTDIPTDNNRNTLNVNGVALNTENTIRSDPVMVPLHNSRIEQPMAVDDKTPDTEIEQTNGLQPVEVTAASLPDPNKNVPEDDANINEEPKSTYTPEITSLDVTTPTQTKIETEADDIDDNIIPPTESAPVTRQPEDVEPLSIFTNDIKYQRFPKAMSYTTLKNKVLDKPLKKLYILEESEVKLFQHVRQVQATYTLEDDILYVNLLFRFVFSRKCQEIKRFKMGKHVGNKDMALFEREMKDGRTERVIFFSDRPEDYVFFMSCTDMKNSPYACRDSYYITLDSMHDPPNQFPWREAATELETKMDLTFEDPRFIFNFVLLPCARARSSP